MKTFEVVCVTTYREVYAVEAESPIDAEQVLLDNYCDRVEMTCIDDMVVEVREVNNAES